MITLILVLAFILRLINLNQSLWLDEAVQAITAKESFSFIFQEIVGDFHPPLYHFLMHFWVRIFGYSEIALRMPSVLFGVGTVWVVYKLGKLRGLGVLGAVFLATAPFHIYYSQEARMYSMACFFACLSMYFFIKTNKKINSCHPDLDGGIPFLDRERKGFLDFSRVRLGFARNDNLLYFVSTLLLVYTDYYGFFILLAQLIYLGIKRKYKFMILDSIFIILCYLLWFPMFVTQVKTGILATNVLPEWGKLVNVSFLKALPLTFVKFSLGRITIFDKSLYAGIILIIGLIYGGLILKAFRGWLKEKSKDDVGTVIVLWFIIPLTASWLASLFIPNFQPFRLLLILPAFYLILSMGIPAFVPPMAGLRAGKGGIKGLVIALILLINIISLSVYYFNPYFYREDWRGTVNFLKRQENVLVILPSETSNWPIKYYDKNNEIKLIGIGKGIREIGNIGKIGDIGNPGKIYYIRYLVSVFDPQELIMQKLNKEGYNKVSEISFNQIPVWEYRLTD